MNTRSIIWIVIVVVLIGGAYYFSQRSTEPQNERPIKIGVIASLTGKGAERGESTMQGLDLALKEINESNILKGREIELVYQDVALDGASSAPSALNLLADVEKVVAIIGPMGSNVALSVTSLIDAKRIPIILHAVSAQAATENNDFVFRLWPVGRSYSDSILSRVRSLGYSKVAALTASTDNTVDVLNFLSEDILFVADERATVDVTDFRTQLSKIKQSSPDVLFINLHSGQNGIAAKQARELGISAPIFTNSVTSSVDLEVGGDIALEGAWFPEFAGYTDDVRDVFIATFGDEPAAPDNAAAAHDALLVFAEAIASVGTDGEAIRDYLYTNTFTGSIGEFSFQENGDAVVPLSIRIIKDGEIIELE